MFWFDREWTVFTFSLWKRENGPQQAYVQKCLPCKWNKLALHAEMKEILHNVTTVTQPWSFLRLNPAHSLIEIIEYLRKSNFFILE